jgi:hypothetical protein
MERQMEISSLHEMTCRVSGDVLMIRADGVCVVSCTVGSVKPTQRGMCDIVLGPRMH